LEFSLGSLGTHVVVGFRTRPGQPCVMETAGMDWDLAGLSSCEAEIVTSKIEVR
jgi:hypothetical protein